MRGVLGSGADTVAPFGNRPRLIGDGDLPELRGGEPRPVPPVRILRHTASARAAAAGDPKDGHDRLLRPEGVDEPRRAARLRVAAGRDDAVLRRDARGP